MANTHQVLEGVKDYTLELLGTSFRDAAESAATRSEGAAESATRDAAATAADRVATGEDRAQTGKDAEAAEGWASQSKDAATQAITAAATTSQYVGEGFPEGKVSAPVGSIYTDRLATAGAIRWIKASGTGNTGWRVSDGYTGIRDITSLIPNNDDRGRARISRTNNLVTLHLVNVPTPGTGSFVSLDGLIPEGFRSAFDWQHLGIGKPASIDASGPLRVGRNSTLVVYRTSDETRVNASVIYESATTWPTVLPGVPN